MAYKADKFRPTTGMHHRQGGGDAQMLTTPRDDHGRSWMVQSLIVMCELSQWKVVEGCERTHSHYGSDGQHRG